MAMDTILVDALKAEDNFFKYQHGTGKHFLDAYIRKDSDIEVSTFC